jgi:hypothetical protein
VDYYDGNKESLDLQTQRIKLPRAVAVDKWGLASGSCPVASAAAASSQDAMEVAQFYTAGACSSPQLTPALRPRLAERLVDTLLMWRVDQTAPSVSPLTGEGGARRRAARRRCAHHQRGHRQRASGAPTARIGGYIG